MQNPHYIHLAIRQLGAALPYCQGLYTACTPGVCLYGATPGAPSYIHHVPLAAFLPWINCICVGSCIMYLGNKATGVSLEIYYIMYP